MSFCSWITDEKYRDTFKPGVYVCSQCDNELFSSRTKFQHFSPWPSFTETVHENSVVKREEPSRPTLTYKVSCGKCGFGLGHEFVGDGPDGKSRFWIFSESLKFVQFENCENKTEGFQEIKSEKQEESQESVKEFEESKSCLLS